MNTVNPTATRSVLAIAANAQRMLATGLLARLGLVKETPDEHAARALESRAYVRALVELDNRTAISASIAQWSPATEEYAEHFFMTHRGDRKARQEVIRLHQELKDARAEVERLKTMLAAVSV
ncbi:MULTISPECIES: hypothetical protein [unclassified Variovorax]|uniref:hypothetical protein n=1 Tax=unclassified Variovorax TaxID=663243 RepID=UPI001315BE20|nr:MULTISPECIES: hypothetical protein [unclassified Variovorax]VTU42815.1 hypothetical protein H6P1_00286 [Variovorax sp. PBL-H6]VTU43659.1 hypothetical protein SRS16P1_00618 [Variovorax sp. SRS16]VTU43722.1 hypothetical protein E5P1_00612 [Variovorax sp. PBL-E5]